MGMTMGAWERICATCVSCCGFSSLLGLGCEGFSGVVCTLSLGFFPLTFGVMMDRGFVAPWLREFDGEMFGVSPFVLYFSLGWLFAVSR
jgi:hypothetical protein